MKPLSLQEKVLAYGALHNDPEATLSYRYDTDGSRIASKALPETDLPLLANRFEIDQKVVLATVRQNVMAVGKDFTLTPEEKRARLQRYIQASIDLQLRLDEMVFAPIASDTYVRTGVPKYIPNKLSDMGSDSSVESSRRSREKITVNKGEILGTASPLLEFIYAGQHSKETMVRCVDAWVRQAVPYDHKYKGSAFGGRSIRLHEVYRSSNDPKQPTAVCRHQALYTQVINQTLGLTSRLLKCDLDDLGAHAANLVRIDNQWHLLDVTNPIAVKGVAQPCFVPIPQKTIDLNAEKYTWHIPHDYGVRTYTSRDNMFYRIKKA